MKAPTIISCLLLFGTLTLASASDVRLKKKADTVEVAIGGEPFAVYNFSKSLPKPFFSPVRGPGGTVLTRPLKDPEDHQHHKGLWVAVDEVNEIKFWAEQGKIETVSVDVANGKNAGPGKLQVVNHWLGKDGKPVVVETTAIGIHPNRLLTYDITFTPAKEPVTFRDTKEGLLAFRMVNSMREKEGGKVINAAGKKGTSECWGQPSDWIDYYGEVDGKVFGVTLMDHPQNLRPSRYHVRNYGLFSINPFGEKAYSRGKNPDKPVVVEPGKKLRLRYGLYVHAGDTKTAGVGDVYEKFVAATQ